MEHTGGRIYKYLGDVKQQYLEQAEKIDFKLEQAEKIDLKGEHK